VDARSGHARLALIAHRVRFVRMRTMVKNGLHAIALNHRVALGPALWTKRGLAQLQALALPPHTAQRCGESLELLSWLTTRIDQLDAQIAAAAAADARAQLLLTHPGVGPLTALITVLVLGPANRFPTSKHVVSYVGLAPAINASADTYHLGKITKQGNALLRWILGQAAPLAARADGELKRSYFTVVHRRGQGQGRPRPQTARTALHHAPGSDRLRRVPAPRRRPTLAACMASRRRADHVACALTDGEPPGPTFQCGRSRGD